MNRKIPRILIVDDDSDLLATMSDILKMRGFESVSAQTGNAALAQFEDYDFDAALIDLRLASRDISGLDILSGIKARSPSTECILITGYATQDSAIKAIQLNVFGYFQKPFEMEQVLLSVQRAVEKRKAAQALRESEMRFRAMFEQAATGVAQIETATGRFIRVNQKYCDIVGYSRAEMEQMDFQTITHPEDLKADLANMELLKAGEIREFTIEKRYFRKSGDTVWVSLTVSPMWAADEPPDYHIAIVQDITARKQAEEQIQNLAKFPAESPNPVLRVSADGVLLYINQAGVNLLQQWSLKVGEAVSPLLQEAVIQSVRAGTTRTLNLTHGERLFAIYIAPIAAAGYANLYGHDITDSWQMRAMREAEARYRVLFEQSPYGVLLLDPETGKIIEANAMAAKQLGYSPKEFAALSVSDYETSESQEATAQRREKILREGSDDFETLHRAKSGEIRNVHVWVKALQVNERVLRYSIFQDITERKRAESQREAALETLRKSEEKFIKVFQASPVVVIISRLKDSRLIEVNESFEKVMGYTREEALDSTLTGLALWVNPAERERLVSNLLANGRLRNEEVLYRTKSGEVITCVDSAELIELNGEKCVLASIENITERKRADVVKQELEVLREMDRLRSDFIGNVSHELRTPLGLILVMVTALRKEGLSLDEETTRGFLRDIEEETRSLQRIVDDLLDISRAQSGNLALNLAQADLRETLKRAVKMFAAQDSNHRLELQLPAYALEARLDASRIEQVLRNLLDNASKFSPAGTIITVKAKKESDVIHVSVSDEGPGIPSSERKRIFERFHRIVDKNAAYIQGLGLGLSISRSIVEAHGGILWVEDRPQCGSVFVFTIPLQERVA
jgi:two-component system CheB/CheR fusion protein